MAPNRQGENHKIVNQRDKSRANAPACATYMRIRATSGANVYTYDVFLGANNTTDFNVSANSVHNMSVTILGTDEVDTRMTSYSVNIVEVPESIFSDAGLGAGDLIQGTVNITGDLNAEGFRVCFKLLSDGLKLNRNGAPEQYFEVPASGVVDYELGYTPTVVSAENHFARYNIEITDADGYTMVFQRAQSWYNTLTVFTRNKMIEDAHGTVTVANDHFHESMSGAAWEYVQARCLSEGCILTAVPNPGCAFLGWYEDAEESYLLSTESTYFYVPEEMDGIIHARFSEPWSVRLSTDIYNVLFECSEKYTTDQDAECFVVPYGSKCKITPVDYYKGFQYFGWWDSAKGGSQLAATWSYEFTATRNMSLAVRVSSPVRLDTQGNANSYIAAERNTTYSFYSGIKGNGKTTAGITPSRNYCNYARVLWESNAVKGSVIRGVGTNGSTIAFTTGGSTGNALVGVFSEDSVLQWSWHIWCTPYAPDATAQRYGNRTFMDRNLGAMSAAPGIDSRGCFYQWGRKDPMPPAGNSQGTPEAAGSWEPGYEYGVEGGRGGEHTLGWSILHPTSFIAGTEQESQTEGSYLGDWISPSNPNLWGGGNGKDYGKSIYDPCPPG